MIQAPARTDDIAVVTHASHRGEIAPPGHSDANTGWAVAVIRGRETEGSVIGFSSRIAVVRFERSQPVRVGDPIRLRLGLGETYCAVLARVLHVMARRDRSSVIAFTLPDVNGAAGREQGRVPYHERLSLVVSDARVTGDLNQRGRAVDLSVSGIALRTDRSLPTRSTVLVRIPLHGQRHPVQIRAEVRWCRHDSEADESIGYVCGLAWQRLSAEQRFLLAQTITALTPGIDAA